MSHETVVTDPFSDLRFFSAISSILTDGLNHESIKLETEPGMWCCQVFKIDWKCVKMLSIVNVKCKS